MAVTRLIQSFAPPRAWRRSSRTKEKPLAAGIAGDAPGQPEPCCGTRVTSPFPFPREGGQPAGNISYSGMQLTNCVGNLPAGENRLPDRR